METVRPPGGASPPDSNTGRDFSLRWRREYLVLRAFHLGSLLIPRSLHRPLGWCVAWLLSRVLRSIAGAVRSNLERILLLPPDSPGRRVRREVDRRLRRAFLNFGTAVLDHVRITAGPRTAAVDLVARMRGRERLDAALARGKGAILATGHMGLWDLGGAFLAKDGVPLTVIAQAGGDPRFNRYRDSGRARRGIQVLWTGAEGITAGALVAALGRLRENGVVALLADRPNGDPRSLARLPFLGKEAAFPTGPAALARASGAPILPAFVVLDERALRYEAVLEEPIEVARTADRAADHRRGTEAWVRVLERWVRAYPEQWYNFYRYWEL